MQTSLIVPGRSTMRWLHVLSSGKQEIVAWAFSNSAAAVWVYYIYTSYGSSLQQLGTYSVLVTRMGNAWGGQRGPGDTRAAVAVSAAGFYGLVWMVFAFSALLLLIFAPELGQFRCPSLPHKVSLYTTLGISSGKSDRNTSTQFTVVLPRWLLDSDLWK